MGVWAGVVIIGMETHSAHGCLLAYQGRVISGSDTLEDVRRALRMNEDKRASRVMD